MKALFIIAKIGNDSNTHQLMDKQNVVLYIHTTEYYLIVKRNEIYMLITWINIHADNMDIHADTCYNMDKP